MSFYRCPKCDKFEAQSRTSCSKCGYCEVPKPAVDAGVRHQSARIPSGTPTEPAAKAPDSSRAAVAKWLRRGAIVSACLGPLMLIAMCLGVPIIPLSGYQAQEIFCVSVIVVPLALYVLSRLLSMREPLSLKIRRWILSFLDGGYLYVLPLIGAGIIYSGYEEYRVGSPSTQEPLSVELKQLEAGLRPTNNHLRIGKHICLYPSTILVVKAKNKDLRNPTVEQFYFPIISDFRPADLQGQPLTSVEDDDARSLNPTTVAVLVKSHRFSRLGDVPDVPVAADHVQGVIVNVVHSPVMGEREKIKSLFPDVDFDRLLILEEGRRPSSATKSLLTIAAGGGLIALLVAGIVVRRILKRRWKELVEVSN